MKRIIAAAGAAAALAGLAGCGAVAEAARSESTPSPMPAVVEQTAEDHLLATAQKFARVMSAGDKEAAKSYLASSCTGVGPAIDMVMGAGFARIEAEELGSAWQVDGVNVWDDDRGVVTGYSVDLPAEADRDRLTWPNLFGDGDDPEVWVKEDGAWFVSCEENAR